MFIVTPEGVVIPVIEFAFQQLKASVDAEDIQELLPFQSTMELGDTYIHITNQSAYPVFTKHHIIGRGDTLCKRGQESNGTVTDATVTCPGCIAKARGVIVNHLMSQFAGDAFAVEDALNQVEMYGFFRR